MFTALMFGFMHLFVTPTAGNEPVNFERLHIFLFNLVSGGSIILYFTEGREKPSKKLVAFYILGICYAVFAFLKIYIPAVAISLALAAIVESIRIKTFSFLPMDFFMSNKPVHRKFHQASLLCLSIGLVISSVVIINNEYYHWVTMEKLKLDTFFLGFSFPLSLITMSVMFSFMQQAENFTFHVLKNIGFWTVNLGVIIFFLFILFEKLAPQILVTTTLFFCVLMIYYLYYHLGIREQQKQFLTSGMGFLVFTALSGIAYIIMAFIPGYYDKDTGKFLMWLHTFVSLYGWNLSGLIVICRFSDFPIRFHSRWVIALHWATAAFLAPLGKYYQLFALLAMAGYIIILYMTFFSPGSKSRLAEESRLSEV